MWRLGSIIPVEKKSQFQIFEPLLYCQQVVAYIH